MEAFIAYQTILLGCIQKSSTVYIETYTSHINIINKISLSPTTRNYAK